MTEEQKYQGALYKPKQNKQNNNNNNNNNINNNNNNRQQQQQQQQQQHQHQHQKQQPNMNSKRLDMANTLALQPYVEDVGEDREYESWHEFEIRDGDRSPTGPPPRAPSPPSADSDDHVNVFDFLDNSQTPTASNVSRPRERKAPDTSDSTSLVRYETKSGELLEPASLMDQDREPLVQYGTGPVPTGAFATPQPKTERRRSKERELKKDKKRKRLHVDVAGDQIMADAPPVLHSGLTGGLKNMMRPAFPPSPDYSGDNIADSPASPLKKTKHTRHHKSQHHQMSNSLFGMIAGAQPKVKSSKHKTSSSSSKKHSHHKHDKKEPKLIEFRPNSKDGKGDDLDGQMIVFKPRADVFLSFVNKGPESERGCSMNKALKRFHRERQAAGSGTPKGREEKELWRSLRLRRNDRGEIVLFSD
jgi:cell growth-regulating nucleolar protein